MTAPGGGRTAARQRYDATVGMTVVSWWKRFGNGGFPDSLRGLEQAIEPWARGLAA